MIYIIKDLLFFWQDGVLSLVMNLIRAEVSCDILEVALIPSFLLVVTS